MLCLSGRLCSCKVYFAIVDDIPVAVKSISPDTFLCEIKIVSGVHCDCALFTAEASESVCGCHSER